jgi:hypothetical protein
MEARERAAAAWVRWLCWALTLEWLSSTPMNNTVFTWGGW